MTRMTARTRKALLFASAISTLGFAAPAAFAQDAAPAAEQGSTVDELVVLILRAELIEADGGRIPSRDVNYRMLRQIALAYPALSGTIWSG